MYGVVYRVDNGSARIRKKRFRIWFLLLVVIACAASYGAYRYFMPTPVEQAVEKLQFDSTVSETEKQVIRAAIQDQAKTYDGKVTSSIETVMSVDRPSSILSVYVPVTNVYSSRLTLSKVDLATMKIYVPVDLDDKVRTAISNVLELSPDNLITLSMPLDELTEDEVAIIPSTQISYKIKLLSLEDEYYLDSFKKGAIFRRAVYSGSSADSLADLKLNTLKGRDDVFKINMTGVTALTRGMMVKLEKVKDATYFSQKIAEFASDADITHVSNEVSFKPGCGLSNSSFCAPPEMIEALKASGVDLVELTGNHNNDTGNQYNVDTINQYIELGWHTFGGGLNIGEAVKPYVADIKGSKVAFLGYNSADGINSGAIAKESSAGANPFDFEKAKADIASAKQQAQFVVVDMQFYECYSYPDGFVEFPICDQPIANQSSTFRRIIDMGADMVIGTQAHQPQTYEIYKDKPIYYGLGNFYFDQTMWPGTERGIILSHYFMNGQLIQTRLTPTIFDTDLQTRLMTKDQADYFMNRLKTARTAAGL